MTFHILVLLELRFQKPIKWEKKYWFTRGKNMKSELYINKAIMQLKKGDIEGAVCSMKKVIEMNDEIINTNVLADLIDKYLLT